MRLADVLNLTRATDRIKVVDEQHNLLYIGYMGMIDATQPLEIKPDMEVTKLTYSHELRDKHWKENGLTAPLEPKTIPDQFYADLEERIYLYIRVKVA